MYIENITKIVSIVCELLNETKRPIWPTWVAYSIIILSILFGIYCYLCRMNKFVFSISKWVNGFFGNTFLISISVFWAGVVSIYSTEIKLQISNLPNIGVHLLIFIISVSIFILGGLISKIHTENEKKELRKSPGSNAISGNRVETINSIKYLLNIIVKYTSISKGKNSEFEDELDKVIHSTIDSILKVTYKLIENDKNVTMRCNLMNLLKSDQVINYFKYKNPTINEEEFLSIDWIVKSPFFIKSRRNEGNYTHLLDGCDGILVCDRNFSKVMNKGDGISDIENKIDKNLSDDTFPLCMPVTIETNDKMYHPNLFGAPEAVIGNKVVYIDNLKETVCAFIKEKENKRISELDLAINEIYKADIKNKYDCDSDKPGSIISIPIEKLEMNKIISNITNKKNDSISQANKCVYVLNIYINKTGFFENDEQQHGFANLIRPISYILSCLMSIKSDYASSVVSKNEHEIHNGISVIGAKE